MDNPDCVWIWDDNPVSNEGYLYAIEKNKGNIIRVTDLFKNYKQKKNI